MNIEIANSIAGIEAIEIKGGYYRIEAVLESGEREVLKKKSTSLPKMVQLYSVEMNGNRRGAGLPSYFTFAKSVKAWDKEYHIRGFTVTMAKIPEAQCVTILL